MQLLFILVALIGAPLFLVFGAFALLSILTSPDDVALWSVMSDFYSMAKNANIYAIPLYTFAGYMMAESKSPQRIINLAQSVLGWLPGGLAIVTIVTCAFFTAFTGASGVTIIALGGLLYPVLVKEGYTERFALGLITSCGSIGLLITPSLPVILYGYVTQVDIDKLFIAGVFPSFLMIAALSVYSLYKARKMKVHTLAFSFRNVAKAVKEGFWEIPLPLIVLGGIYGGVFSATEAAGITALYVFIVQVLIYRDLKFFRDIPRVVRQSMILVGGILIILGLAVGVTRGLTIDGIPQKLFELISPYIQSQFAFLIALNIFLLIVGCLMDIFSAITVVVPLITVIAKQYHVDPILLAIIFLVNLEIGYLTPPVGLNLFLSSFRFGKSLFELYRIAIPYLIILLICLVIITYYPPLSLGLIQWLGK